MLRTIIIEDEKPHSEFLQKLISNHCKNVEVVTTAESVIKGIQAINQHKPDFIFLDIKISSGTGFDVLECIPDINFEVIFTTSHNEYALKAIKVCAIDYLIKPIDPLTSYIIPPITHLTH